MHETNGSATSSSKKRPLNNGRRLGQKPLLTLTDIWAIRARLQLAGNARDLTLFNLAIDSKLRGCDLEAIKIADGSSRGEVLPRAIVTQKKTGRPVQLEITEQTQEALSGWLDRMCLGYNGYLFPSRVRPISAVSTRQSSRLVKSWIASSGHGPRSYGTHSSCRSKSTSIYRRTQNLRAAQLLLGHT